jgi:hypothetical protein
MPQLFKTDPRESGAANTGLTTADLAHTSDRSSPAQIDRPIDEVAPSRLNKTRTSFNEEDGSFFDQDDNTNSFEERSGTNPGTQIDPLATAQPDSVSANRSTSFKADSKDEYSSTPLFTQQESGDFHARWDAVQVSFVDEPRRAVQEADSLVAGAMKRLAEIFADERANLDKQWDRGDSVSTEDLRIALRRYRSFFGRLLSV